MTKPEIDFTKHCLTPYAKGKWVRIKGVTPWYSVPDGMTRAEAARAVKAKLEETRRVVFIGGESE